jgi:hypothetical protein
MTSAVPILVGVVGSPDDTVSDASALGQTFAAYVEDLRVRHPHSDIVVLTTLGSGPELAVIRALDRRRRSARTRRLCERYPRHRLE